MDKDTPLICKVFYALISVRGKLLSILYFVKNLRTGFLGTQTK